MLGHKSAAMTLDVYSDLFDDDLEAVGTAMNEKAVAAGGGQSMSERGSDRGPGTTKPPPRRGFQRWLRPASIR